MAHRAGAVLFIDKLVELSFCQSDLDRSSSLGAKPRELAAMKRLLGRRRQLLDDLNALSLTLNAVVSEPAQSEEPEFQPAAYFVKGAAARLRKAAAKTRKTKRVATRIIDGVVCYSVADVRRWWPELIPKKDRDGA
jgi:hypothetical protein